MVKLSVLVIGLSVFSISSCYNLGKLYISEDLSVSTTLSILLMYQFNSVQSLSPFRLFVTPWTAAHQTSLSITNSQSLLKLMSIESMMPPNHLILSCPLLFLPSSCSQREAVLPTEKISNLLLYISSCQY